MTQVWACGGGTQSAAIAGLICAGKLERPDYALMVDTEREKSSTWRYVCGTILPRLKAAGVDLVIVPKSAYATVDLFGLNGDLLIPAYTAGGAGKLNTYCSNEWKSRVMDRWLREQGVATTSYVKWLGFSLEEMNRVRAGRVRYPLILEYPMRRSECRSYVCGLGWKEPPRGGSACWMCPNMTDAEWAEMRDNDPDDFAKAGAFDEDLRKRDPNVFIHRSGEPLVQIGPSIGYTEQRALFGCESGMCFV